jgi:hypothetical protein
VANRETSLSALVSVLEGVEALKAVSREFRDIRQVASTQFPMVIIEDDGKEEIINKSGDYSDIVFTISIIGYINNKKGHTSQKLNELDVLVKKTLGVDFLDSSGVMRSAGLEGFRIKELVERSGSEIAPYGWFEREIELRYESRLSLGL